MKDENGAIKIGASYTVDEEYAASATYDIAASVADKLGQNIGHEFVKHIPVQKDQPVWLSGTVYHVEAVVMSIEDDKKLAETAWMYKDLTK